MEVEKRPITDRVSAGQVLGVFYLMTTTFHAEVPQLFPAFLSPRYAGSSSP